MIHPEVLSFNAKQAGTDRKICDQLAELTSKNLPEAENRVWHAHPVWFLNGNPIVGYSRQKNGIRLMFWSGKSFEEPGLTIAGGKFQDASVFFRHEDEINMEEVERWLEKSRKIQWDYKNLIKRKGELVRLL